MHTLDTLDYSSPDAVILADKPAGITSFGVVARIRRRFSEHFGKRMKVGHTGTLDPFATGLMILLTGKECRNAMQYSKLDKVYEATIRLGQASSTGDPEGEITTVSDAQPSAAAVEAASMQFVGEIRQRPPIYSAIKVNGERAYKLARKGIEVEVPERTVTIHSIEIIRYAYPELVIRAHVGSGTYIRTLAEDIGKVLETGAYCTALRRTKVGQWRVEDAYTITE